MKKVGSNTITPGEVTFLLIGSMIGVGILSLPNDLVIIAKQDAWISAFIGAIYPLYMVIIASILCKGKASSMIAMNIKGYPSAGDYIEGLIKNAKNYNFFSNNYKIIDLFLKVDSEGRNITLPYVEITDKGIGITGMALFKKDKMVAEINADETKTMNMLKENNVKGILTIQKNAKEYTNYYATSKRKVSCTKKGDKYNFTINIDLKGDIITDTLYKDLQNSTEKNAEFNKKMAEEVKKKSDDFIVKMNTQYKVDCLDLGEVAAAKYGRQTGVDWNSIVCNSRIEVNVKVKVQKTGRGEY